MNSRPILRLIRARPVIHIEDAAVGRRDEAGTELIGVLKHGEHDLGHVGDQPKRLGLRRVDARLMLHLDGRDAVQGGIRLIKGVGGKAVSVFKKLRGKSLQRHHVGPHI